MLGFVHKKVTAAALVGAVLFALVLAMSGVFSNEESAAGPEAPAATTTTSTTTSTTTPERPPFETVVATATVPMVEVYAELPNTVEIDEGAERAAFIYRSEFSKFSPERSGSEPIPSESDPVVGRRKTPNGWEFDNPTPFDSDLVFVVTEDQGEWLRVQLPVRPNGAEGWIRASDVELSTHEFRIEIDLSDRSITISDGAEELAASLVVIGSDDRSTPTGRYFVTDFEPRSATGPYGPWVIAISGFSQDLDSFSGGAPLIALHGTNNPNRFGTAASNGCVRLPNDLITFLRDTIPLGTPVDISE